MDPLDQQFGVLRSTEGEQCFDVLITFGRRESLFGARSREWEMWDFASKVDLDEAETLGAAGIEAALRRETGVMVGIRCLGDMPYTTEICTVPIADVANKVKLVPADMISSDGFNVTEAALRYLRPLAAGAEEPIIVDGLPRFLGALNERCTLQA